MSGMTENAKVDTITEGNPSTRKSRRQGAIGPDSPILRISHASVEAKVVARGAAICQSHLISYCVIHAGIVGRHVPEMNMAVR